MINRELSIRLLKRQVLSYEEGMWIVMVDQLGFDEMAEE
jgi:hypothetical protein